jgi:hypothetical protein
MAALGPLFDAARRGVTSGSVTDLGVTGLFLYFIASAAFNLG